MYKQSWSCYVQWAIGSKSTIITIRIIYFESAIKYFKVTIDFVICVTELVDVDSGEKIPVKNE